MAGLGHDTTVQGLDLDGVAPIVDLDLGPGVAGEAAHAGPHRGISLGCRHSLGRRRRIRRGHSVADKRRGLRSGRSRILRRCGGGGSHRGSGRDRHWRSRLRVRLHEGDAHANVAELDLIPALEVGLGDPLTVDQRPPC